VTLASSELRRPDAQPSKIIWFLHGILGSRSNWRTFARKVTESRPGWSATLIDLRMHGDSLGLPPPHTVAAAALDLEELAAERGHPSAIVGHSFGGKVALAFAERRSSPTLETLVIVDSMPGRREEGRGSEATLEVLAMLRSLPDHFATREEFVELVVARGQSTDLARWLAMNLVTENGGFRIRLDLDAIDALLADYFATDLWHVIEDPKGLAIDLVIAGRSSVFDRKARARALAAAETNASVHVHVIEEASHWVHVDAPDELLDIVTSALAR
jgi:esterase